MKYSRAVDQTRSVYTNPEMANVDVINRIFSKIDVDQSGSISKSEMDNAFKLFDKDGENKFCEINNICV